MSESASTNHTASLPSANETPATVVGNRGGVSRVLAKLEASVESGNFYEAHQMYRTLYFRYLTQKRYADCLDLLYNGSLKFLQNEQFSSGADLGILVVDTLEKRNATNEDAIATDIDLWINRLGELIRLINANVVERETLQARAIKWSSDTNRNKFGHPLMHKILAQIMWNEGSIDQARHHFLLSRDGAGCGRMLVELSQSKGLPSEIDMFITQVTLQQLCLNEKVIAAETFETYTKYHPKIACCEPPFQLPLLNFTYFLLRAVDERKQPMFKTLCDMYKIALARDPSYEKYLQKIGVIYFGVVPVQQRAGGGLFGDLINQLLSGLDGEEEEDDEDDHADGGAASSVDAELD